MRLRIPVKWSRTGAKRRWLFSIIEEGDHMGQEVGLDGCFSVSFRFCVPQ